MNFLIQPPRILYVIPATAGQQSSCKSASVSWQDRKPGSRPCQCKMRQNPFSACPIRHGNFSVWCCLTLRQYATAAVAGSTLLQFTGAETIGYKMVEIRRPWSRAEGPNRCRCVIWGVGCVHSQQCEYGFLWPSSHCSWADHGWQIAFACGSSFLVWCTGPASHMRWCCQSPKVNFRNTRYLLCISCKTSILHIIHPGLPYL